MKDELIDVIIGAVQTYDKVTVTKDRETGIVNIEMTDVFQFYDKPVAMISPGKEIRHG